MGPISSLFRFAIAVGLCFIFFGSSELRAQDFQPNDKVEVREGDEWSSATYVKREGRKHQIRYEDGTEEWVAADRIRAPGGAPVTRPASPSTESRPATSGGGSEPSKRRFKKGDRVQVRWGSQWKDGTIREARGSEFLVNRDDFNHPIHDRWYSLGDIRFPGDPDPRGEGDGRLRNDPVFRHQEVEDPDRPLTVANINSVREANRLGVGSGFSPDPGPTMDLAPKSIVMRAPVGKGAGRTVLKSVAVGDTKLMVHRAPIGSFGDSFPTIEVIDLESGKSVGVWPTLRETKLAALRADGKVVAIQSDRLHSNTKGRLDIYSLGSEPKFQVGFVPFQEINPEHRDVHWVEFIGTKYLATSGGWPDRDLYVWELPSCRAVWKTPLARQAQPAVSPGRRQIAVSDENGIAILNAETGDLVATIPTVEGEGKLAFSPDGDRIAVVNRSGSLCVFDIANGDLLHRMGADATKAPQWAGPQHILVGDQLYSLRHSLKLWRYFTESNSPVVIRGNVAWYPAGTQPTISSCPMPTPEALKAEENVNYTDFILLPGGSLSLDIQLSGMTAQVTEAFRRQLTDLNFTVADGQPVKLRATLTKGQPQEMEYRVYRSLSPFAGPFHRGVPTSEVHKRSISPIIHRIEIVDAKGRPCWERTMSIGPPSSFSQKEGETIDQAIQRVMAPKPNWFIETLLPTNVPKPEYINGYGASDLTPSGAIPSATPADAAPKNIPIFRPDAPTESV